MIAARCVVGNSRTACISALLIIFAPLFVLPGFAARWDPQGAANAFEEARQKRNELARNAASTLGEYLECAKAYRSVHLKDPHYGRTGDAIYEEGLVYQEIAHKFSKPEYYKSAARRFELLIKDYGGNSNCPSALIRLMAIYSTRLGDEDAAQRAYRCLHTQYGYSDALIKRMQVKLDLEPAPPLAIVPSVDPESTHEQSAATGEGQVTSQPIVQNIRFWSMIDYTRIIIDIDAGAKYEKARISDPERLYFDISNVQLSAGLVNRTFKVGDDILKNIRVAQKRPDLVRVVLDVSALGDLAVSEMHNPFRIVIDLYRNPAASREEPRTITPAIQESRISGTKQGAPAPATIPERRLAPTVTGMEAPAPLGKTAAPAGTSAGQEGKDVSRAYSLPGSAGTKRIPQVAAENPAARPAVPAPESKPELSISPRQASSTSRGDRTLTRMLGLKVGRIVIDPGHGGHDFGTIGPGGLPEKTLVLSLARSLQKMIQDKLGAEVILTRGDDTFITLDERTSIANRHKADLFISLHANSSRIRSISGVETYYLDFAKTDAEREIAARENATTVSNVSDLEDLIKKIAKADKSAESRELASIVQKRLYSGARRAIRSTKDRGVRSAPFMVLIGANMPSVLAEVAFISNPKDERLLGREATRQNLVKALFSGIEGYMKTLGSDVVQNQRSSQGK